MQPYKKWVSHQQKRGGKTPGRHFWVSGQWPLRWLWAGGSDRPLSRHTLCPLLVTILQASGQSPEGGGHAS